VTRLFFFLPFAIFVIIGIYLGVGLTNDPSKLPVVLAGKIAPNFSLAPLKGRDNRGFSNNDLTGKISLLNFWGSWCISCKVEHSFLMKLKTSNAIQINGINWREKNVDSGFQWLKRFGDPYNFVGVDPNSKAAIGFGVTGAPETFLIDADGRIRFKHVGPLNQKIFDEKIVPLITTLQKES